MTSSIIGIHGLSNKPKASDLAKWWHKAMLEGLKKNAGVEIDSLAFSSVYWADVLYDRPDPKPDRYRAAKAGALKRYDDGWLDMLRKTSAGAVGSMTDALKNLFGIDKAAEFVLDKKLKDLHAYYNKATIRNELRGRLRAELVSDKHRGKRIMLISHSMGSIIAYDVLRELGKVSQAVTVDHFITIGSPIGLPHVKYRIAKENPSVRTPSIVRKWTNLADRRDPVALDPHLADDFKPNDMGVQVMDDLVLNDWGGINHKSYGYLRTPEFSEILANFI